MNTKNQKTVKETVKKTVEQPVEQPVEQNVEQPVDTTDTALRPLSDYWGMPADEVTKAMLGRSDVTNHPNLIITNVIDKSTLDNPHALIVVVNRSLPQYLLNADTGKYEEGDTCNIFTSRIQLSAILKGQGETVFARIVETQDIMLILAILEKARISVMSRFLGNGETYVNPYAAGAPREIRKTDHDRIEFFPYELVLDNKFSPLEKIQLAQMFVAK